MKNANDKERFIELRAEGRSYADIAVALKISKPTLIAWGKEVHGKTMSGSGELSFAFWG